MTKWPHRPGFSAWEHFGLGILGFAIALVSVAIVERSGMLDRFEFLHQDVLFLSHGHRVADRIAVVLITDDDYKELFSSTSPLRPAEVRDVIGAAARSGAKVIAIDLDTSSWTSSERRAAFSASRGPGFTARLVWARTGSFNDANGLFRPDSLEGLGEAECSGVPAVVSDSSHVIRWYRLFAHQETTHAILPGMAIVIDWLDRNKGAGCYPPDVADGDEYRFINFEGGGASFFHVPARGLLGASRGTVWPIYNPLSKKIVLIGGAFSAARDKRETPGGMLDGVDILANSVISVRERVLPIDSWVTVLVDVLFDLTVLFITFFYPSWRIVLVSSLCFPIVLLISSLVVYSAWGYFLGVVPVVCSLWLNRLIEPRVHRCLRVLRRR
jgi:hypothetical protein